MFDNITNNFYYGQPSKKDLDALYAVKQKLTKMAKGKKNAEALNALTDENVTIIGEIATDLSALIDEVATGQVTDETLEKARAQNAKLKEIAGLYTPETETENPGGENGEGGEDTGTGDGTDTGDGSGQTDENGNPIV